MTALLCLPETMNNNYKNNKYNYITIYVKLGKLCSSHFSVPNRVRQSGILSPKLFSVYVDDLSVSLSATKTFFCIGRLYC